MSDIVERLRKLGSIKTSQLYSQRETLGEAAYEIERLAVLGWENHAKIKRLTAALQEIADDCQYGTGLERYASDIARKALNNE